MPYIFSLLGLTIFTEILRLLIDPVKKGIVTLSVQVGQPFEMRVQTIDSHNSGFARNCTSAGLNPMIS